jgi:ankyrin repeat protein
VVRILIEYDPANINARDEDGSTPLFWALKGRYFKDGSVLRLLLEHGADIHAQSLGGWIPLHWASFNGALEVVRLLLELGADIEVNDKNDKAALQYAAETGHGKVVKLLREHGANWRHLVAFSTWIYCNFLSMIEIPSFTHCNAVCGTNT